MNIKEKDRSKYGLIVDKEEIMKNDDDENPYDQYVMEGTAITKFDYFSIMTYTGDKCMYLKDDVLKYGIYNSQLHNSPLVKDSNIQITKLSPLDEIAINLLYSPVLRKGNNYKYQPEKNKKSPFPLYYCGRQNVTNNGKDKCGPLGPNCSACRVLFNKEIQIPVTNSNGDMIWQGWSGLFYCGDCYLDNNDKLLFCGPDDGDNCPSCRSLLEID